jgi:membrane-bound lytic murein transglycosylase B
VGELSFRFRTSKRLFALSAALVLPLSSAAATASVVTEAKPMVPSMSRQAPPSLGRPTSVDSAGLVVKVAKATPTGWTRSRGHRAVVTGSVRQRVKQVSTMTSYDMPVAALTAYRRAAAAEAVSSPGCRLSWPLLAGIGTVESDNGQFGGAVVLANGDTSPHILGPVLNGTGGVGAIRDTDGGRFDGDPTWDRAVGPMQFIPGTWAAYGADGNGDGVRDPNNIKDAALAAAHYLCAGGGNLTVGIQARAAIMRYNHSVSYADLVLRLTKVYASGAGTVVPNGRGGATNHQPPSQGPVQHPALAVRTSRHGHGANGSSGDHRHRGRTPKPPHVTSPPIVNPPILPVHRIPVHRHHRHGRRVHTHPRPPSVTGVLQACKKTWCLDATRLDFGIGADLALKQGDYNGDGRTQTVQRELASLEGQTFTMTVVDPTEVTSPTTGGPSSPTTRGPSAAVPLVVVPLSSKVTRTWGHTPSKRARDTIAITVDTDGVVTTINGLAYAVTPTTEP